MEGDVTEAPKGWRCLHQDLCERIGRGLPLRDLLSARAVCRQWRLHVSSAVSRLPCTLHPTPIHPTTASHNPTNSSATHPASSTSASTSAPSTSAPSASPPPPSSPSAASPQAPAPWPCTPAANTGTASPPAQAWPSSPPPPPPLPPLPPMEPPANPLVELDAQPPGREAVWRRALAGVAACLPRLSELLLYVSSRVPPSALGPQLASLPSALPALTKLELRFLLPSSAPLLGAPLQQLQPGLTALTGLTTLYLVMGASPEPAEILAVLPLLPRLADVKLLSGLPQYGLTNAKLAALGAATQLRRLHLEVSGVDQVDVGLAALSRLRALRQLWLDGVVALGAPVVAALGHMSSLQELRLELDSPTHLPDLFELPHLQQLRLAYHGDELDGDDSDSDDEHQPPQPLLLDEQLPAPGAAAPEPPDPAAGAGVHAVAHINLPAPAVVNAPQHVPVVQPAVHVANGRGPRTGQDWEALERLVCAQLGRARPLLVELGLHGCCFPQDPLPRIAQLRGLASLLLHDCRWPASPVPGPPFMPPPAPAPHPGQGQPAAAAGASSSSSGSSSTSSSTVAAAVVAALGLAGQAGQAPPRSWGVLAALTGLQALTVCQCVAPPISTWDLARLGPAWPGLNHLQLQSAAAATAFAPTAAARYAASLAGASGPPADFGSILRAWPRLESLCLNGTWANPRSPQTLDVGLLPTSLTSLSLASLRLVAAAAERRALAAAMAAREGLKDAVAAAAAAASGAGRGGASGHEGGAGGGGVERPPCSLPYLEHLVLGEVQLGPGVTLAGLAGACPHLRSLELSNLSPPLTDAGMASLSSLTALTVLRVSQDSDPADLGPGPAGPHAGPGPGPGGPQAAPQPRQPTDSGPDTAGCSSISSDGNPSLAAAGEPSEGGAAAAGATEEVKDQLTDRVLSGAGLRALRSLRALRQLEWLPWGCEPLGEREVAALAALPRLQLVTLRGASGHGVAPGALAALRDALPLCDLDDTEWSGLVE
ncbi:hypothetical protein HYH03_006335 [Edaphochlamys debaryana]|uniref:F-box domain-containing protein n=1 Tax=Edaphochlamys debaryana TaxID=47281 RepID=A0A835Y3C3_9CHLO|nr:hypothetical protein HYH03_006335 [Edaphochlamys debaryana]|eukprot:KAG2495737.1 hypothetical protein HYH03_006335 [Edaphochlamys debaryana]